MVEILVELGTRLAKDKIASGEAERGENLLRGGVEVIACGKKKISSFNQHIKYTAGRGTASISYFSFASASSF